MKTWFAHHDVEHFISIVVALGHILSHIAKFYFYYYCLYGTGKHFFISELNVWEGTNVKILFSG